MYGRGPQVLSEGILPNTSGSWVMMAAGIVTMVAGVAIVATTIAFIVAKKAHKA